MDVVHRHVLLINMRLYSLTTQTQHIHTHTYTHTHIHTHTHTQACWCAVRDLVKCGPPGLSGYVRRCFKWSWQSLLHARHSSERGGVTTSQSLFVVVHPKCTAGCLCYWNKVQCIKRRPLMAAVSFLQRGVTSFYKCLPPLPPPPPPVPFLYWEEKDWMNCGLLWHLATYYCCFFRLKWGIAALKWS